jgi:hypothetical protein
VYGKNFFVSFLWREGRVAAGAYDKNSFVSFSWRDYRVAVGAYGKKFFVPFSWKGCFVAAAGVWQINPLPRFRWRGCRVVTRSVYGKNSVVSFSRRGCRVLTRQVYGKNSFVSFSWKSGRDAVGRMAKNSLFVFGGGDVVSRLGVWQKNLCLIFVQRLSYRDSFGEWQKFFVSFSWRLCRAWGVWQKKFLLRFRGEDVAP